MENITGQYYSDEVCFNIGIYLKIYYSILGCAFLFSCYMMYKYVSIFINTCDYSSKLLEMINNMCLIYIIALMSSSIVIIVIIYDICYENNKYVLISTSFISLFFDIGLITLQLDSCPKSPRNIILAFAILLMITRFKLLFVLFTSPVHAITIKQIIISTCYGFFSLVISTYTYNRMILKNNNSINTKNKDENEKTNVEDNKKTNVEDNKNKKFEWTDKMIQELTTAIAEGRRITKIKDKYAIPEKEFNNKKQEIEYEQSKCC